MAQLGMKLSVAVNPEFVEKLREAKRAMHDLERMICGGQVFEAVALEESDA